MNEEYIPEEPKLDTYTVSDEYHTVVKGMEYAIRTAAICMHRDHGGEVSEFEENIKHELCLHLFAGESLIGEYNG